MTLNTVPRDDRSGERRRRSDGERSRRTILAAAARLATVEGIEGLSIGALAKDIGMSKSGLYAHFGSKEELQLATIGAAQEVFDADVISPALEVGGGLARAQPLCERFLSHIERGVFPGGCFFASVGAELDTRPRPRTRPNRRSPVQLGQPHRFSAPRGSGPRRARSRR